MLFHFSCPNEKVYESNGLLTKSVLTQALNGDKKTNYARQDSLSPCRSELTSLFSIILNCSLATKQAKFFYSGCCFGEDYSEALSYLTGK